MSARAKLWGQVSIRCSAQLYFRGTYVCTPTGDKTAPTATASPYYDGEHFTVTISATDNSGEVFYYAENTTRGTKQISSSISPSVHWSSLVSITHLSV